MPAKVPPLATLRVFPLRSWRLGERLYWLAMSENAVAHQIVDGAYRVHTTLGPGLLESVYQAALAYELESVGYGSSTASHSGGLRDGSHRHRVPRRLGSGGPGDCGDQGCGGRRSGAQEEASHVLKLTDKRLGLLINF